MKNSICVFGLMLAAAGGIALAQTPTIDPGGVVNVASYAYSALPSGGIAQGSIFGIFGKNLGPTPYAQATGYPLPTSLSNVTVKVTSGSTTVNAVLFLVSASQINALLPSSVPTGTATLTVTNNGQTSAPASFKVAANSFGTFALNQGGSGPGIITNAQSVPFGLTSAANPDDPAVIWGTGIGGVQGNEANGALPGDMPNVPVEVYVGSTKANVTYRGRSGCCAGLDQITFTVPNVLGCHVPVTVKIANVVSNFTSVPVAPKGSRTCSDPNGPSPNDLQKFMTNGNVSVGAIVLSRTNTSLTVPVIGTITTSADIGAGTFLRYNSTQLNSSQNPFNAYTIGSCTVTYYKGSSNNSADPTLPKSLDAGASLMVNGKPGPKSLDKMAAGNGSFVYSGLL
ncbi:MAG: hypothetical protein KGN84_04765, partial [Acidobacteriota bacterium]|nr:hypothetical protein [Acidobacteriota bacterium]